MQIWNMQDPEKRVVAIDAMEKSLSAIGVEGGNCQLKKDEKKSGKSGNVVMKPRLNGVVAAMLFCPSPWSMNDRVWKDEVMSEHNNLDRGQARLKRFRVWEALEVVQPYLTGLVLKPTERMSCRSRMDSFGKAFLEVFGKTHITPYIVSFNPCKFTSYSGKYIPLHILWNVL
jgi:hypothetical protein